MFLLLDVANMLDSVIHTSCCWDEYFEDECEDECEGYADPLLDIFPNYDALIDSDSQDGPLSVQGRLREHSQFWKEKLDASRFVLDIVTDGYRYGFRN